MFSITTARNVQAALQRMDRAARDFREIIGPEDQIVVHAENYFAAKDEVAAAMAAAQAERDGAGEPDLEPDLEPAGDPAD